MKVNRNFIFSILIIINSMMFLLITPSIIYNLNYGNDDLKSKTRMFMYIPVCLIYFYFSFKSYFYGIDLDGTEVRRTGYAVVSEGDKEFFKIMSKPIAFIIQLIFLIIQIAIIYDAIKNI